MKLKEKTIKKNYIYKGKVINVRCDDVELPNGNMSKREVVEHRGGVGIIPIDGSDVILIKQFRYAFKKVLLEIPAGKREKNEKAPLETAYRELQEEIGAVADKLIYLGEFYPTVGYDEEIIYLFVATGLHFSNKQNLDEDEFLNIQRINYKEALEMVKNNEIKDAKTIIGLLRCGEYVD